MMSIVEPPDFETSRKIRRTGPRDVSVRSTIRCIFRAICSAVNGCSTPPWAYLLKMSSSSSSDLTTRTWPCFPGRPILLISLVISHALCAQMEKGQPDLRSGKSPPPLLCHSRALLSYTKGVRKFSRLNKVTNHSHDCLVIQPPHYNHVLTPEV